MTYIYIFYISNFSPAALIYLHFIFIPFWQILTFLQIQLSLSSYFSSDSLCALSLSFVLSACITTHTCSISLSLSLSNRFYISFFLSISFSHIAFLSPPPSSVCVLNVVHTQALNLKMPHTVSITHVQCDDSQSPAGYQIQSLSSPPLLSLSVFPSSPLSSF